MLSFTLWIMVTISGTSAIVLTAKVALDEHLLRRRQSAVPSEDVTAPGAALSGLEPLSV
jgi:hypothetical protein